MFGIESKTVGIYNFDYFSIDMTDGNYQLGGREFPLGTAACAVANLSLDTQKKLLRLGAALNDTRHKYLLFGIYSRELFQEIETNILNILRFVKTIEPFSFFDVAYSAKVVRDILSPAPFEKLEALLKQPEEEVDQDELQAASALAKKNYDMAYELLRVYCYLVNDAVNFSAMIRNFTANFMQSKSRRKDALALYAFSFCNSEEVKKAIEEHNYNRELDSVNLRPRVTQVPVFLWDKEDDTPRLARRLYFGRLMDFLIAEWFEGMMHGHYLWQCGVCKDYFLMTTAHRQLYCGKYNPEYRTTCDHVANNRRLGKEKGLSPQKKQDDPLWLLWHKRYNSIRKNKSLGKYSEAVSAEAKRILDNCYERVQIDAKYAQSQYEADIELSNLYALAEKKRK